MTFSEDDLTIQTVSLLESRLKRIEFALVGDASDTSTLLETAKRENRDYSIKSRLNALEGALARLASSSPAVKDLLQLHASHPELFISTLPAIVPLPASSLTHAEKLSCITAVAPSFQTTASMLAAVKDLTIPDPEISADLIDLQPRIDRVSVLQEGTLQEMGELRSRSTRILERWYLEGVEGVNKDFAEWDERLRDVEVSVMRREREELD